MINLGHILAIEEARGMALPRDMRERSDLLAHVKVDASKPLDSLMQSVGGTAVISMRGPVIKEDSFWVRYFGYCSSATLRQTVLEAASNSSVKSILLAIESPGGSVFGISDLAQAVYEARKTKRVYAYIEDIGASAAYWVASQADKIFCNSTALVGSIGTYMVIPDYSKMAKDMGIEMHVVKAGEFKGAATPGTAVTKPQLEKFQQEVDALNDHFLAGVARGRRMSIDRVKQIATGEVWVGKDAQAVGLVDGVQTIEETLRQLQAVHGGASGIGRNQYAAV